MPGNMWGDGDARKIYGSSLHKYLRQMKCDALNSESELEYGILQQQFNLHQIC